MRLSWRDGETLERCKDMEFILYGREGGAMMEGMAKFKYLGWPLDQADDDCLELRRNVKQERKVWGRLGKILRREGAYSKVAEMLYKEVLQVVLLFGSETRILSAEI